MNWWNFKNGRMMRLGRWRLGSIVAALGWYLASLDGAEGQRQREHLDRAIAQANGEIRTLEFEFAARASMAQIERWNSETLALGAPRADQYLPEAALASLGSPIRSTPRPDQIAMLTATKTYSAPSAQPSLR